MSRHMGRSWWPQHFLEDECPCPKEPCGLVDMEKAVPECPEHWFHRAKSMREFHDEEHCADRIAGTGIYRKKES